MPLIAEVGRRSPKVRAVILMVYAVLILGSVMTVFPFLMMLSGATATNHTTWEFRLVPRYLYNERSLFEAFIFLKSYDHLEWQWKMPVPPSSGRNTFQSMVPGRRPGPDTPIGESLATHFCVDRFDDFRRAYESAGSLTTWNEDFRRVVEQHYPFAVDELRAMVEADSDFEPDRHAVIQVVRRGFFDYLGRFARDFDEAGRPDAGAPQYREILERYPVLADDPEFRAVMQDYFTCRKPDLSDPRVRRQVDDFYEFRATLPLALRSACWFGGPYRQFDGDISYQAWVRRKYGTIEKVNEAYGTRANTWVQITEPQERLYLRSQYVYDTAHNRDWYEWKAQADLRFISPAATEYFWSEFLQLQYGNEIAALNRAYGTDYVRFFDVPLAERVPASGPQRDDWIEHVRTRLAARYMQFDGGHELWNTFLLDRFGTLEAVNAALKRDWENSDQIRLPDLQAAPVGSPPTRLENDMVLEFVKTVLPPEMLRLKTPEILYRQWLQSRYGTVEAFNEAYGTHWPDMNHIYFPMAVVDWKEFDESRSHIRWFTFFRAYRNAWENIALHKRSLWNTFVFCASVVLAALVINPLCAYALSRFNLPGTYKILLFLLATMAFPAEVTMIPNFLLLKSFPLLRIVICVAGVLVGSGLAAMFVSSKRMVYPLAAGLAGGILGATIVTDATQQIFEGGSVSLLNTYWALVLPGVASGYSIFILKGFFDSLPQELYESAVIDGAGEMRIFTQITLPMSTPVLAVIALWSFTAAYGSFTWALIICQDPRMWTLMVHLYQYQMVMDPAEDLAALTLASIPTLIVFLVAQKVILKGIILPTYK